MRGCNIFKSEVSISKHENEKNQFRNVSNVLYNGKKIVQRVPGGYWDDRKNHKKFMDWLGKQLGFKTMDDWYYLDIDTIRNYGGRSILDKCNNSPSQLVQSVYPHHSFKPWKFHNSPKGFWNSSTNQVGKRS
jgi:hypothetical protein